MVQKVLRKSDISKKSEKNEETLVAVGTHAYRRIQRKHKDENEAKQNKRNTRERRHGICKPNVWRI